MSKLSGVRNSLNTEVVEEPKLPRRQRRKLLEIRDGADGKGKTSDLEEALQNVKLKEEIGEDSIPASNGDPVKKKMSKSAKKRARNRIQRQGDLCEPQEVITNSDDLEKDTSSCAAEMKDSCSVGNTASKSDEAEDINSAGDNRRLDTSDNEESDEKEEFFDACSSPAKLANIRSRNSVDGDANTVPERRLIGRAHIPSRPPQNDAPNRKSDLGKRVNGKPSTIEEVVVRLKVYVKPPVPVISVDEMVKIFRRLSGSLSLSVYNQATCNELRYYPRGIENRRSNCYMNSVIQALFLCPEFFKWLETLLEPNILAWLDKCQQHLPILHGLVVFLKDYKDVPKWENEDRIFGVDGKMTNGEKSVDADALLDVLPDLMNFEPSNSHQDAQEYLHSLLYALQREMTKVNETVVDQKVDTGWQTVVKSRKKKVKNTKAKDVNMLDTPITKIFRGVTNIRLQKPGESPEDKRDSFFTFAICVQDNENIREAFARAFEEVKLTQLKSSKFNTTVEGKQSLTLQIAPPILILHLKIFVVKDSTASKLLYKLEIPTQLEIVDGIGNQLATRKPGKQSKSKGERAVTKNWSYKLASIVYHIGTDINSGHYVLYGLSPSLKRWICFDDTRVTAVSEKEALQPGPTHVPYLLFYHLK